MARITSLNILLDPQGKDFLAELYGKVIYNIQKNTISSTLKNNDLSGTPTSGTVEAKRFVNAASKDYGTARAAGKGDAIKAKPVVIAIDQNKEIVEELEEKDITLYGVDGVMNRRSSNHVLTMTRELERAFFLEAAQTGAEFSTSETDAGTILEEAIQQIETTRNDFVDGVPRDMIKIVATPDFYGKIREYLDKTAHNSNVDTASEEFYSFHGVSVRSSVYLPTGIDFIVMVVGAVAQPVLPRPYNAEKIPLSEAFAVELFFYYGTKAVMPDLIAYKDNGVLGALAVTSVAGATTGTTKITVSHDKLGGRSYVYKTAASVTAPTYGQDLSSGWTVWDGVSDITATTGHKIVIAEVDSAKKCKKAGEATVASAS